MRREPWIWAENGVYVRKASNSFDVFRPAKSGTHAYLDSAYASLDLALCRALYLARGAGRHASEAMRLAESLA